MTIDDDLLDIELRQATHDLRHALSDVAIPEPHRMPSPRPLLVAAAVLLVVFVGAITWGNRLSSEAGSQNVIATEPDQDQLLVEPTGEPVNTRPTGERAVVDPTPTETALQVPAPSSTQNLEPIPGLCFGDLDLAKVRAQEKYTDACGVPYNDTSAFHKCEWTPDGWRCQGPGGENTSTSQSAPSLTPGRSKAVTDSTGEVCFGEFDAAIQIAQANYSEACGIPYDDMSGFHQCEWMLDGWVCRGPRGNE